MLPASQLLIALGSNCCEDLALFRETGYLLRTLEGSKMVKQQQMVYTVSIFCS